VPFEAAMEKEGSSLDSFLRLGQCLLNFKAVGKSGNLFASEFNVVPQNRVITTRYKLCMASIDA